MALIKDEDENTEQRRSLKDNSEVGPSDASQKVNEENKAFTNERNLDEDHDSFESKSSDD